MMVQKYLVQWHRNYRWANKFIYLWPINCYAEWSNILPLVYPYPSISLDNWRCSLNVTGDITKEMHCVIINCILIAPHNKVSSNYVQWFWFHCKTNVRGLSISWCYRFADYVGIRKTGLLYPFVQYNLINIVFKLRMAAMSIIILNLITQYEFLCTFNNKKAMNYVNKRIWKEWRFHGA